MIIPKNESYPDNSKPISGFEMSIYFASLPFQIQFEILSHLQKSKKPFQMDSLPQLRLSPPVIYHETVNRSDNIRGQSSKSNTVKGERSKRLWQIKDLKSKGFRTNLFGESI